MGQCNPRSTAAIGKERKKEADEQKNRHPSNKNSSKMQETLKTVKGQCDLLVTKVQESSSSKFNAKEQSHSSTR